MKERIEAGLVTCQPHPSLPLFIWNYTPKCQYSRAWDEWTKAARGLITDQEGKVVARPFPKSQISLDNISREGILDP